MHVPRVYTSTCVYSCDAFSSQSHSTSCGAAASLQGILETKNFKGEALVVYHTSKFTGTHDAGAGAFSEVE